MDEDHEDRILEGLLLEPEIKFGDVMNVIESFEKARGSTLFFNPTERERTTQFFDSRKEESTPRDNAMDIIKMLRVEADRMLVEEKREKMKEGKGSEEEEEEDSFEKINSGRGGKGQVRTGSSKGMDLQERRRTSSEYRIRGMGDEPRSSSSSDTGSEMGVEQSLLVDEQEPTMLGDDSGIASPSAKSDDDHHQAGSSRPPSAAAMRNRSRQSSTLSINTQYSEPNTDDTRQRARTAQGISFPREDLVSPPRTSFSRTSTSGIPRATRRSDPSSRSIIPHPHPPASSSSTSTSSSTHPPSSFTFGPSPTKPRPGRTRSGSAESTSTARHRVNVPPGAFGMGVPYSAGLSAGAGVGAGATGSRPPSVARSRRSSQDTVVNGDDERERTSHSNRSVHPLNRPKPPRQTSSQRKSVPFPRSNSQDPEPPNSPDLNEMRLPDVSLIGDQSFVGPAGGLASRNGHDDDDDDDGEFGQGIVLAEADISRMGRGSIADTTMNLDEGQDDGYRGGAGGAGYGVEYGMGVGGRRRKISGERMMRLSTDSNSSIMARAKINQLQGENQELQIKTRALEDKLTAQGNDTETMQGRLLDLENHLKDETSEKKRLERELKQKDRDNQTALTELENKLSSTQEQLRDLKSALTSATSMNVKLKDDVNDLTRAIREKEDEISSLMSDLRELKDDKEALSRDLQDLHKRFDQNETQLDKLRQHNRELKQQLQQQDELNDTIGNLNQEVADLRLRLSHSHARGGTETSTMSLGTEQAVARGKRSLADDLDGVLDEEEEGEEDGRVGLGERRSEDGGVTTIYHTTTVRRVVRPRTVSAQGPSDPAAPATIEEEEFIQTTEYTDASTQHEPRFTLVDAYSQTDESHGTTLPPYTSKPEHEIIKDALDRAHPRVHDDDAGDEQGGLEAMAEYAEAYEKISKVSGIRCDYIERGLKEKQDETMERVEQARISDASESAKAKATTTTVAVLDPSALSKTSGLSYFKLLFWSMLLVIPAVALGVYAGYQYQVMAIEEQFWWVWHNAYAPPRPPRYIAGTIRERWGSNGGYYGEFPI